MDPEVEKARHKIFNYAVETLNETIVNEKLDHFFNNLKCAAKVNVAFGFFLKNIEDGGFRYFYAHENNTLLDRSKLVCIHDNLAKLKNFLIKTDVTESCSRERMNTKWRFYKLSNLTAFAFLLSKIFLWGAKTQSYPNHFWRNAQSTVSCLKKIQDNHVTTTCAYFVRLLSTCTEINDWKKKHPKIFDSFINKKNGLCPNQFKRVHMNDIPIVEDLLTLKIPLYDIDIVAGNIIGEFARRSVQKYDNTVRLLRYNNHICYVSNINAVFQSFRCHIYDTFFNRTFNLERQLSTCSERVKNIYPRNVYQILETLFHKLDSFGIKYTRQKNFSKI